MLDQDFSKAARMSFRDYLGEKGFKKRFIDELGQMASLVNYDQSVDTINAFPGEQTTRTLERDRQRRSSDRSSTSYCSALFIVERDARARLINDDIN